MQDGPETLRANLDRLLISALRVGDLNLHEMVYGDNFKDSLGRENQQFHLPSVLTRAGEGTDHEDLKRRICN